jgi:hypothetical protein
MSNKNADIFDNFLKSRQIWPQSWENNAKLDGATFLPKEKTKNSLLASTTVLLKVYFSMF